MMQPATIDRRLAAILIADIVGYSKLMGADEVKTLETLRFFQSEVLHTGIAGNRGRIVKGLGDGWLVEFSSSIAAVNCAMQLQDRLAENQGLKLRIGVHVGDIIVQDEDIYGDGVNIASRLEQVAEPGGIAISETVFASLDGTKTPSFDQAGEQALKNIARQVRIWTRSPLEAPGTQNKTRTSAQAPTRHKGFPRLSVVPLTTSDQRSEVQELADAVTNDLGQFFNGLGWLSYKTTEVPKAPSYVLNGLLRSRGDRLRLEVRLTGPDGDVVWSGKLDGDLTDSFDWQDKVSEEITSNVIGFIFDSEVVCLAQIAPKDRTAEQCFLHGLMRRNKMSSENFLAALGDYSLAIEKDPTLTEAYAEAIFFAMGGRTMGLTSELEEFSERHAIWMKAAKSLAHKSAALDLCIATATFFKDGAIAPLRLKIRDVLRRAPFDVKTLVFSGWGSNWSGDFETALACFQKVEQLARFSPYASITQGGSVWLISCSATMRWHWRSRRPVCGPITTIRQIISSRRPAWHILAGRLKPKPRWLRQGA
ncbi:MAG: adenylate/guanylate cyclase domain-containing protein [Rhizobiaceae bacterium]